MTGTSAPSTRMLGAAWAVHLASVAWVIGWLIVTLASHERALLPSGKLEPPLPIWAVTLWFVIFAAMIIAPRWPALGLVCYALLATIVARYEPGINIAMNVDVLGWLTWLCVTSTIVWAVRERVRFRRPTWADFTAGVLFAMCLWIAVSAVAARLRTGEWSAAPEHHPRQFIQALILFLLAAQFLSTRTACLTMALTMGAALCIRGQFLSPYGVWMQEDIASLLVITLPITVLALSCVRSTHERVIVGVIMLVIVAHSLWLIAATQNRGAAVALAVVLVTMWAISRRIWLNLLIAGPIVVIAAAALYSTGQLDGYIHRFTDAFAGGREQGSVDTRTELWKAGWAMGKDRPILGIGPGHFNVNAQRYNPSVDRPQSPHNNFIAMLAETGFPGLMLYTLFMFSVLASCWITVFRFKRDWPAPAARALFPAMCGYLTIGLFITRQDLVLAYLLAGWAVGLQSADREGQSKALPADSPAPRERRRVRRRVRVRMPIDPAGRDG